MIQQSETPSAPALLASERTLLLAGLGAIVAVAWAYLIFEHRGMESMIAAASTMEMRPRDMGDFVLLFVMWVVMMVAMMVPSATPAVLLYAAVARRLAPSRVGALWTAAFVSGYALAWSTFSVVAALLQVWLEHAAVLSPTMVSASPVFGGILIAGAGLYQLSPAKDVCLRHCRAPLHFVAEYWRPGAGGALYMGLLHGAYCVGCCWLLMGLLFVVGVMNLFWVAAIAAFILLEKIAFVGSRIGRFVSGCCLIALGAVILVAGV